MIQDWGQAIDTPRCKKCGADFVRLSSPSGWIERILSRFDTHPFRCQTCGHRFFLRQAGKVYTQESDKREYARVPAQFSVVFKGKVIEGKGQLVDLSVRGCALETNTPLVRGEVLHMTFMMPDGRPPVDIEAAVVRYTQGTRVGLEFLRIADKPETELREYVEKGLRRQQAQTV